MPAVVDSVVTRDVNLHHQKRKSLALVVIRMSPLGQDPDGYAKACSALTSATEELGIGKIDAQTLIVTGSVRSNE